MENKIQHESCEIINSFLEDDTVKDYKGQPEGALIEFLEEKTAIHYSLRYFEYKEEKEKRLLNIEKRLFEIKDEHLELIKELNIIKNELSNRLNQILK